MNVLDPPLNLASIFDHLVAFETFWFRNTATYRETNLSLRALMDVLYSFQIWCSLFHPTLRTTPIKFPPENVP